MVRALAIAALLAGVIVACSFRGQPVGLGNGDAGPDDAALHDAPTIVADASKLDAGINPGLDAMIDAMIDARSRAASRPRRRRQFLSNPQQ